MQLHEGMLFELAGRFGVGKLAAIDGEHCTLDVFHSIARRSAEQAPMEELPGRRAFLTPQTRVYLRDEERYRVGRVRHFSREPSGLVEYEIRFPNGQDRFHSETDLFIRPWFCPDDPADVLASGGAESQYLHDRRLSATRALQSLRSAAQGMTALISAGVELVPHQVAAVRRILSDPLQRYLLADEVGLGKTIEAGLVIRQRLIDDPDAEVLIAAPRHLIPQWQAELCSKLCLEQFGQPFEVLAHEDLIRVNRAPQLLVIDEAHHLVGVSGGPLADAAARLMALAHEAPSLLLLSATPALGDDQRFLALLHLLDPEAHPLEDLEGFRVKLAQRRDFGRLLLSLDPEGPGLVLRQRAQEVIDRLPDDPVVQEFAPRLIQASQARDPAAAEHAAALRQHIADTYRIHQRLIRSRRADAAGWEFRARGPQLPNDGTVPLPHVREEIDPDPRIPDLLSGLEDWRNAAAAATERGETDETIAASRFVALAEALSVGCKALAAEIDARPALFAGETAILSGLRDVLSSDVGHNARLQVAVESVIRLRANLAREIVHPKIVAFASATDVAARLADALPGALLLTCETDAAEAEDTFALFSDPDGPEILVVDRCGEEGLNLSFADAIVHLDLPFSAARLEQRIGRLDRFGRQRGIIRHRLLLPSDEEASPWAAWQRLLAEGFLLYHDSISDVQFLLDEIESDVARAFLRQGAAGVEALIPFVRKRIEEERTAQHEQSALDRIALAEEPAEELIEAIDAAEEREDQLERDVDAWMVHTLFLRKRPCSAEEPDPFTLRADQQTMIPKLPWREEIEPFEGEPLSWRRRIAMRRSEVTLLRPGMPLIDTIERYTRWDDRGTAFVTWRRHRDWAGEPWMGFRLCLVSEPDVPFDNLLRPDPAALALWRRAQGYLPQSLFVLHVNASGEEVRDEGLLRILQLPYAKDRVPNGLYRDTNLGSRPETLHGIIDAGLFAQLCRSIRDQAKAALAGTQQFRAHVQAGAARAQADLDRRRRRLAQRSSTAEGTSRELGAAEAVLRAVERPAIRLDAIGFMIVSGPQP